MTNECVTSRSSRQTRTPRRVDMAGDGARETTERPSLTLGAIAKSLAAGGIAGGVCVRRCEEATIGRWGKTRRVERGWIRCGRETARKRGGDARGRATSDD